MRAIPVCPVWLLEGSGFTPVSQWNNVLLPEPENPTMPTFMSAIIEASPQRKQGDACPLLALRAGIKGSYYVRRMDAASGAGDHVRAVPAVAAQRGLQIRVFPRTRLPESPAALLPRVARSGAVGRSSAGGGQPQGEIASSVADGLGGTGAVILVGVRAPAAVLRFG